MTKKKWLLIFIFLCLFPINIVLANNLTITMLGITKEDKDRGNDKLGDCTIMESNGDILLLDTCDVSSSAFSRVKNILETTEYNNLYIYISHYHTDHYNGLTELLNSDKININTIYLPKADYVCKGMNDAKAILDDNSDKETYFSNKITDFKNIINLINENNTKLTFLWPAETNYNSLDNCFTGENDSFISSFKFGDALVEIIGPVGNHTLNETGENNYLNYRICHDVGEDPNCNINEITNSNYQMKEDEDVTNKKKYISTVGGDYINNMSLVAKITIDNSTILTAGDIEVEEEDALVNKYGDNLKSDIIKLSHHGYLTSNRKYFLQYVEPKYAFSNGLMSRPSTSNHGVFPDIGNEGTVSSNRFDFIVNGSDDYLGANIYNAGYNGETTITIENNYISTTTTDNKKTITFKAFDKTSNEVIKTINHDFSSDNDLPYKVYYTKIPIDGYLFDSDTIPDEINNNSNISENATYELNYIKAYDSCNDLICNDKNKRIKNNNIVSNMNVNRITEKITINNSDITLNVDNGNSDYIHTGNTITFRNGFKDSLNYTFILNGDLNSDGIIGLEDAQLVAKYIINGTTEINNEYLPAGDTNNDNNIKINDIMRIIDAISNKLL